MGVLITMGVLLALLPIGWVRSVGILCLGAAGLGLVLMGVHAATACARARATSAACPRCGHSQLEHEETGLGLRGAAGVTLTCPRCGYRDVRLV